MYNVLYGSQSYVLDNVSAAALLTTANLARRDGRIKEAEELRALAVEVEAGRMLAPKGVSNAA